MNETRSFNILRRHVGHLAGLALAPIRMKTFLPLLMACAWVLAGCTCCEPAASGAAASGERVLVWFDQYADLGSWTIEDDVVMGGRSQGAFSINEAGNAVFSGEVSLENNGGFSSVQRDFDPIDISQHRAVVLGLKGDGKRYQLRIEASPNACHAYAYDFQTSGAWQAIEIPFADMYAIRHGDRLDLPNCPGQTLTRIQLLIGNRQAESFRLEIDKIWLD